MKTEIINPLASERMCHFHEYITEDIELPVTEKDVVMSHKLCGMAEQSYQEGRPIKVDACDPT